MSRPREREEGSSGAETSPFGTGAEEMQPAPGTWCREVGVN